MAFAANRPSPNLGLSRQAQNIDTLSLVSYDQLLKKGRLGHTYLYHPSVCITGTITSHQFEGIVRVLQMRFHLWIRHLWLRWLVGLWFKLLYWGGILLLLPISIIEIVCTVSFSYLSPDTARQVGLTGQIMSKYADRDYAIETLTIYVKDEEMASAIRSTQPVIHDDLGWRYEFPSHIPADRIAAIGRCWRMANDFRVRIICLKNAIECVPGIWCRPLFIADMYMNGRPEFQRRRVFKMVKPCVRLMDPVNTKREKCSFGEDFNFEAIVEGDLFRQFSLLALRDRLVRDDEARSFGANPDAGNAMIWFIRCYVRTIAQVAFLIGGNVFFSESSVLERTAFAITFGIVVSEAWMNSSVQRLEIPVGTKPGSPYQTDRNAWIRFRETRAPFSSNMSSRNSCFLLHKTSGQDDIPPVRIDELAVVHGVLIARGGFAFFRDGYSLYAASVGMLADSERLCIDAWNPLDGGNTSDVAEKMELGSLYADSNHSEDRDKPHMLFPGDTEVGCS